MSEDKTDQVNHPPHYTKHPSGIECIQVTEHFDFLTGNAIKYLWRHRDKGTALLDLKKARWYVERLIEREEAREQDTAFNIRIANSKSDPAPLF